MSSADANDHARVEFFRLGVHYYVAGRFAALTRLFPTSGNLLHHVAEMFLKGALVRIVGLDKLRNISHDLNGLWREFKTRFVVSDSDAFDHSVAELDRFERLRYPDNVIGEGMEAIFDVFRSHRAETSGLPKAPPRYSLVLEDVDVLVKVIFEKVQVNPRFVLQKLTPEAMDFLSRQNLHRLE
jgi:hypothetical protein